VFDIFFRISGKKIESTEESGNHLRKSALVQSFFNLDHVESTKHNLSTRKTKEKNHPALRAPLTFGRFHYLPKVSGNHSATQPAISSYTAKSADQQCQNDIKKTAYST
jgi:hypothetical protein